MMQSFGRLKVTKAAQVEVRSFKKGVLIPLALVGFAMGAVVPALGAGGLTTVTGSKATVIVDGKKYRLSGGTCVVSGTKLDIGIGTSTNSLAINAVVKKHKFSNAQIGLIVGGRPAAITSASGTATSRGGTFTGTDVVSGSTVTGTFTC